MTETPPTPPQAEPVEPEAAVVKDPEPGGGGGGGQPDPVSNGS
jgi:hypothetical protein